MYISKKGIFLMALVLLCSTLNVYGEPSKAWRDGDIIELTEKPIDYAEMKRLLGNISSEDTDERLESWFRLQKAPFAFSADKIIPELGKMLLNSVNEETQIAILEVLCKFGKKSKPALPEVQKCLESKNESIRHIAKTFITALNNPSLGDGPIKIEYINKDDGHKMTVEEANTPIKREELKKLLADYMNTDFKSMEKRKAEENAAQQFCYRKIDPSAYDMLPQIVDIIVKNNNKEPFDVYPLLIVLANTNADSKTLLPAINACLTSYDCLVRALAVEMLQAMGLPDICKIKKRMTIDEVQKILKIPGRQRENSSLFEVMYDFYYDGAAVHVVLKRDTIEQPKQRVSEIIIDYTGKTIKQMEEQRQKAWGAWVKDHPVGSCKEENSKQASNVSIPEEFPQTMVEGKMNSEAVYEEALERCSQWRDFLKKPITEISINVSDEYKSASKTQGPFVSIVIKDADTINQFVSGMLDMQYHIIYDDRTCLVAPAISNYKITFKSENLEKSIWVYSFGYSFVSGAVMPFMFSSRPLTAVLEDVFKKNKLTIPFETTSLSNGQEIENVSMRRRSCIKK